MPLKEFAVVLALFLCWRGSRTSGINAEFRHGVLKLYIPKMDTQEVKENHYIAIE